ncbi:DUF3341 domain-containing protein [Luteibacter sp. CQ10]|uniref:DUF3341 domain-containing protein n=1 Tax=Luteibacter sp. CQ10 TaxID=2805821 RepID=UPI0034A1BA6A
MTVYGRLLQMRDEASLVEAVGYLREMGYSRMETFAPWALEGLEPPRTGRRIAPSMLIAGLFGGVGTLVLQQVSAHAYPIDAGGRPLASWPAFVPAALEVAILFAVIAGVFAFFAGSRPALYRPEFNVEWFDEASRDGFLLLIRADDPYWDEHRSTHDAERLHPLRHAEVPA